MSRALLPVDDAIAQIIAAMPLMPSETLCLNKTSMADLIGRVLADDITAALTHPPHDVSAMDGYAVRASDVATLPATLTQIGESAAGHPFDEAIGDGEAVRIFTGGYCPQGTEVIILQEDTTAEGNSISISDAPKPGVFIRPMGNDFRSGKVIAKTGEVLTARKIALIAAAGHGEVNVRKKPVVAVISTGDELVAPGVTPEAGQIVSSNGVFLCAMLTAIGATPLHIGIIGDNEADLSRAFDEAASAQLIITSGGASVGEHDGIARHMTADASALTFWRIAMRPGKPLIFGHVNGTPLLGLPGNPVSTGVCGVVFAGSAIRAMLGQDTNLPYEMAVLDQDLPANDKRQDFLRAKFYRDDQGRLHAKPFDKQDSGMLNLLAEANGFIIRLVMADAAKAGDLAVVLPIPHHI